VSHSYRVRSVWCSAASSITTVVAMAAFVLASDPRPALGIDIVYVPISELDANEYAPAIAYDSKHDEYLVVWHDAYDVLHGRRVTSTGSMSEPFAVSTSPNGSRQASVAYDPGRDRYLVTWVYDYHGNASDFDIYGRFIPWNGPSAALTDFPISSWTSNQSHPVVAFAGAQDEFLVVWASDAPAVATYLSGRRIFADGSGFPPGDGFPISSGTEDRDFPDVAYDSARNEYLVAWQIDTATGGDIYGVRLAADGLALGDGEFAIAGWPADEEAPSVAACAAADQYLVAWQSDQDTGGSDWAIYGRFVTGAGVPGNVPLIEDTTAPQIAVDTSCDAAGEQYLAAWQDFYVSGQYGVWARVVHPDESMEPSFGIRQPDMNFERTEPVVGGGATTFLVAWEHDTGFIPNRDIWGGLIPSPEPAAAAQAAVATLAVASLAKRRRSFRPS